MPCLQRPDTDDNDTPVQPQLIVMGAARRDPRGGEIPVYGITHRSLCFSKTQKHKFNYERIEFNEKK